MTWASGELIQGRRASYRVQDGVWEGSFSRSYKVERSVSGIRGEAVLKFRKPHSGCADVLAEGAILARLNHPNLPHFLDFDEAGDPREACLIQTFAPGESIDQILKNTERPEPGEFVLPPERLFVVGVQVCQALDAIHQAGFRHNVLDRHSVIFDSASRHACVLDAGVVNQITPEILDGDDERFHFTADEFLAEPGSSERADLFSLGVLLFAMAAGCLPHTTDFTAPRRRSEPATLLDWSHDLRRNEPWVHALSRLISELTAPDPQRRPASAAEVRERLRDLSMQYRIRNQARSRPAFFDQTVLAGLAEGSAEASETYVARKDRATSPRAVAMAVLEVLPRAYDRAPSRSRLGLLRDDHNRRPWSALDPSERNEVWKKCSPDLLANMNLLSFVDVPSMERTANAQRTIEKFAELAAPPFDDPAPLVTVAEAASVGARLLCTFDARFAEPGVTRVLQSMEMNLELVGNTAPYPGEELKN